MKIAVFHELAPFSGARKVVDEYGKILNKNHKVDLFYVDDNIDNEVKNYFNKVYFFEFKSKKWNGRNWKLRLFKDSIELIQLYFLHKKISKIIQGHKYDFIFVNPSRYTQAPFLLQFIDKTVYFCQEPLRIVYEDFFEVQKKLSFHKKIYEAINRTIRKKIDRNNLLKADLVLANSKFSKKNIKNSYGLNATVCYLGVDIEKFKPKNFKKTQDILFIGENAKVDGYDLLKRIILLFDQKLKVKIISRDALSVSEKKLVEEYSKSKIYLALSRNEPFGLASIEAMACETPVVAINEGGFKETVVNNVTGYLIKRDVETLKEKIDLILNNDILRNSLGKSGREHVKSKFTWELSVDRFMDIVSKNL